MLRDPVLALDFDLAATARLLEAERSAMTRENTDWGNPTPAGTKDIHW